MNKRRKKKKKKKVKKQPPQEFLDPTDREIDMANAYGGIAKGQQKRQGIKYDEQQRSNKKRNVSTPGVSMGRQTLNLVAGSVSGLTRGDVRLNETGDNFSSQQMQPLLRNELVGNSADIERDSQVFGSRGGKRTAQTQ